MELTGPDGRALGPILAQPKRLALLAYLAVVDGGGFQRRDVLLNLFWSEFSQERARSALRKALYFLRQSLTEGVIVARGDEELALARERISCDVVEFREAMAEGRLEDALALYRGDLLPGFFIPDAAEFERWLDGERLHLRQQAAQAAAALSARAEAADDLEKAVRHAHTGLVLDAQSEPAFRRLAGLLHGRGDHAGVAHAYEGWKRRLHEEYGIEPSPETQQLVAAMLVEHVGTGDPEPHGAGRPDTSSGSLAALSFAARPSVKGRRVRSLRLAGALTVLAILIAGAIRVSGTPAMKPERVLVTVFENHTGSPALDPIGRMAADWIASGLMQTGNVEVVSTTSALFPGPDHERQDAGTMAAQAGAGTVVSGAYYLERGVLRMQGHVTDAATGRLLHTLDPIRVPPDSAPAGVELLRQKVSGALAARFDWPAEWTELTRRSQPPTYAAYAEFVEGWETFSREMFSGSEGSRAAAERFERAWALDTTFHLAGLYASLMYVNLRDRARRDSVLEKVARNREQLAPGERLLLEHFQAVRVGDKETALRTAREVNKIAPNSMLAGHAYWAVANNRPREALEMHRELDLRRGLLNGTEHYWRWITIARHMLGDYRQELSEARLGRVREPQLMGPLFQEARALAALGRTAEVERVLEESLSLPPQSFTPAAVMLHTAAELRAHGRPEAAARVLEKAIAWYDTPLSEMPRTQRETLARTYYAAHRWEEARVLYEELVAERPANVHSLGHLGALAARRGDREEADRISAALTSFPDPPLPMVHMLWRARIAALLGDSEQALFLLRKALAEGLPHELGLHTIPDFESLRRHPTFQQLLRPKG